MVSLLALRLPAIPQPESAIFCMLSPNGRFVTRSRRPSKPAGIIRTEHNANCSGLARSDSYQQIRRKKRPIANSCQPALRICKSLCVPVLRTTTVNGITLTIHNTTKVSIGSAQAAEGRPTIFPPAVDITHCGIAFHDELEGSVVSCKIAV